MKDPFKGTVFKVLNAWKFYLWTDLLVGLFIKGWIFIIFNLSFEFSKRSNFWPFIKKIIQSTIPLEHSLCLCKHNFKSLFFLYCCDSGMLFPDSVSGIFSSLIPDLGSRIQHQHKRGGEKINDVTNLFCSYKFLKIVKLKDWQRL